MPGKFEGDVSPGQAWDSLAKNSHAVLVAVRTQGESKVEGLAWKQS